MTAKNPQLVRMDPYASADDTSSVWERHTDDSGCTLYVPQGGFELARELYDGGFNHVTGMHGREAKISQSLMDPNYLSRLPNSQNIGYSLAALRANLILRAALSSPAARKEQEREGLKLDTPDYVGFLIIGKEGEGVMASQISTLMTNCESSHGRADRLLATTSDKGAIDQVDRLACSALDLHFPSDVSPLRQSVRTDPAPQNMFFERRRVLKNLCRQPRSVLVIDAEGESELRAFRPEDSIT